VVAGRSTAAHIDDTRTTTMRMPAISTPTSMPAAGQHRDGALPAPGSGPGATLPTSTQPGRSHAKGSAGELARQLHVGLGQHHASGANVPIGGRQARRGAAARVGGIGIGDRMPVVGGAMPGRGRMPSVPMPGGRIPDADEVTPRPGGVKLTQPAAFDDRTSYDTTGSR
jgi:hypothetical protein